MLRNLVGSGFRGVVYPVNPAHESVLGVQCWPDLAHLPRTPDLAVICSPAAEVPDLVRACGEAGVRGAGHHLGRLPRDRAPRARRSSSGCAPRPRRFDGMRILGPNCLGFIVPEAAPQR